jgi:hypothetical protein
VDEGDTVRAGEPLFDLESEKQNIVVRNCPGQLPHGRRQRRRHLAGARRTGRRPAIGPGPDAE